MEAKIIILNITGGFLVLGACIAAKTYFDGTQDGSALWWAFIVGSLGLSMLTTASF
tara:strand:- start:279 stop:446 length:168 start_codon:yes stop_codon:yes gene_type:complete